MNATSPETLQIVSASESAKQAISTTFFVTFALQFLARGIMKKVWPLYSSLQIMLIYLLYLVKVPSNIIVMSDEVNKIINMEFVPKE